MVNTFLTDIEKITDKEVVEAINTIGKRLKSGIKNPEYRYKFHIVISDHVNAFTLPGGNIVIYTGLIELCDNPEELASVIAHEMGHAENKHIVTRLMKEFGLSVLMSTILNDQGGAISSMLKSVISAKFDRDQERQADDFAFRTMEASNLDPVHFADLFEKMIEKEGSYGTLMEMIMTHPNSESRIKMARNYILKKDFNEQPFDNIDFELIKMTLGQGI